MSNKLNTSFGSTFSEVSDSSSTGDRYVLDINHLRLQERAPLLFRGTEESPTPIQSWKDVIAEIKGPQRLWSTAIVALLAALTSLFAGYTLAYPSSALIDLNKLNDSRIFKRGSSLEDIFGAIAPFGALFGGGIAGLSADRLGRKPTLFLTVIPNFIGWSMLGVSWFCYNAIGFKILVLTGRFLSGFGMGWAMLCAPMYIAEISLPVFRGLFSALPQLMLAIGILMAYCIGSIRFINYYQTALIACLLSAICAILVMSVPETPRFLVAKGHRDRATSVLKWLRGPRVDVMRELFELDNILYKTRKLTFVEFCHEMRQRNVYIPFILMLFIMAFQQLSGINALIFYGAPIFSSAGVPHAEFIALFVIGLTEILTTIITVFVVDLFGRKFMLIASALTMAISCAGIGTHLYLVERHCHTTLTTSSHICSHTIPLAITSVILLILGFSLGMGAIPWTLITELIPLRVRGYLGGILSAVNWGFAALVTGLYLLYSKHVGEGTAWWTFSVINLCAIVFIAILLPETKGKKLEVIEQQMLRKYKLCAWK